MLDGGLIGGNCGFGPPIARYYSNRLSPTKTRLQATSIHCAAAWSTKSGIPRSADAVATNRTHNIAKFGRNDFMFVTLSRFSDASTSMPVMLPVRPSRLPNQISSSNNRGGRLPRTPAKCTRSAVSLLKRVPPTMRAHCIGIAPYDLQHRLTSTYDF